jgi:hypothetical protein
MAQGRAGVLPLQTVRMLRKIKGFLEISKNERQIKKREVGLVKWLLVSGRAPA